MTFEEWAKRHEYCVSIPEQIKAYQRSEDYKVLGLSTVLKLKSNKIVELRHHCDHPEDRACGFSREQWENSDVPNVAPRPRGRPRKISKDSLMQSILDNIALNRDLAARL